MHLLNRLESVEYEGLAGHRNSRDILRHSDAGTVADTIRASVYNRRSVALRSYDAVRPNRYHAGICRRVRHYFGDNWLSQAVEGLGLELRVVETSDVPLTASNPAIPAFPQATRSSSPATTWASPTTEASANTRVSKPTGLYPYPRA